MTVPVQWLLAFYIVNQIASALIQSLPTPTATSRGLYVFIYKFLSLLIADFKSFTQKLPEPPIVVGVKEPVKS